MFESMSVGMLCVRAWVEQPGLYLAGLLFQVGVELYAVATELCLGLVGSELPDQTRRVPRRATAQGAFIGTQPCEPACFRCVCVRVSWVRQRWCGVRTLLQQDHVGPPELGQMEGHAGTDHAATDNHWHSM